MAASAARSHTASELDLALLNALQLRPRADWNELAETLGVTASTAARRWKSLHERGLAWVGVTVGPRRGLEIASAFVLVTCSQNPADVADRLCREPQVATIARVMGRHDLLLDVLMPDFEALRDYLADGLPALPGVGATTSLPISTIFTEGSRWRVRALDAEQVRHLRGGTTPDRIRAVTSAIDEVDRALVGALVEDGRTSWSQLGVMCGTSAPTARRRVQRLLDRGVIELRCELATPLVGPAVQVTFLARIPVGAVIDAGRWLSGLPQCRVAAAVVDQTNLVVTMWFATATEVSAFEGALTDRFPDLVVVDRIVHLRAVKRIGHTLDSHHRSTGVVPLMAW